MFKIEIFNNNGGRLTNQVEASQDAAINVARIWFYHPSYRNVCSKSQVFENDRLIGSSDGEHLIDGD